MVDSGAMIRRSASLLVLFALSSCGDDGPKGTECPGETPFAIGDDGVQDPLAAPAGEARAGRAGAGDLPQIDSGMLTWKTGDFILANEHVAFVVEDVGESDLYDPWGGRPVGMGRVEGGSLVKPADFGEFFILVGRFTVMTETVTVIADGTDGGPAIVRAEGPMRPLPFFDSITRLGFPSDYSPLRGAIDYVLEPGAEHIDVIFRLRSPLENELRGAQQMNGFMYLYRMRMWTPEGSGFATASESYGYVGFIGDEGVSYAYVTPGRSQSNGIFASGFGSSFVSMPAIPGSCDGELELHHARIVIGEGSTLDSTLTVLARAEGHTLRTITGRVVEADGTPVEGASVNADRAGEEYHLSQTRTGADGTFTIHVPAGDAAELYVVRRGDVVKGPISAPIGTTDVGDLTVSAGGWIVVEPTTEAGAGLPVPARIQLYPSGGSAPSAAERYGERLPRNNRIAVAYALPGERHVFRAPVGDVRVLVSRGYEYSVHEEIIGVAEENCDPKADVESCPKVAAVLDRVVDTPGVMCGDFHIHTVRSNDSADSVDQKLRSAAADGLEIPGRSEHEFLEDWDDEVVSLELEPFVYGLTSLELTTFESYGHFGVLPLDAEPERPNGGSIAWQRWPSPASPDDPVEPLTPTELFDAVFARAEDPVLIVNHPRGGANYFSYAGLQPDTGLVTHASRWDERFDAIEIFNSSPFARFSDELGEYVPTAEVRDWFSLLQRGLRVPAVGASDTHGVDTNPVGYPRTCLELGRDDLPPVGPGRRALADDVRDAIRAGTFHVSGGHYLDVGVEDPSSPGSFVGPGGVVSGPFPACTDGVGTCATLSVRLQAAPWIEVDVLEVFVDGERVLSIPEIDLDGVDSVVRHEGLLEVPVTASSKFVVVASHANQNLAIHAGRKPFGASNPIYLAP
jgi:hypothetical protein